MKTIKIYNVFIIIISLIIAILNSIQPLLLKNIIDNMSLGSYKISRYFIFMYLFITVFLLLVEYINKVLYVKFKRYLQSFFRANVTDSILNSKKISFNSINNKEYFSVYNNEINSLIDNYYILVPNLIFQIFSFIFYTIGLFYLDTKIAIIILVFNIIATLIPHIFEKKLQYYQDLDYKNLRLFNIEIDDLLVGFNTIKEYQHQNIIRKKIYSISDKQQKNSYKMSILNSKIEMLIGSLFFGYYILILFLANQSISKSNMTVGDLVAIISLADLIVGPIMMISSYLLILLANKNKKTEMVEKYEILSPLRSTDLNLTSNSLEKLEFKNVSLKFADKIILDNFNMVFEKNKKYLIIGPNGSGKSSILKIIFKDIENYSGNVFIDGKNIKYLDDHYYNKYFAYIGQSPYFFNDSIINNIVLNKEYDRGEVEKIIEVVNLKDDFVFNDNLITDDLKITLSGGEKQKIAISRGLFYRKTALVFDESTSQIDRFSSQQIEDNILNMEDILFINIDHYVNEDLLDRYDSIIKLDYNGSYEVINT